MASFCSARSILLYRYLHTTIISVCWSHVLPTFHDHGFENSHRLARRTQQGLYDFLLPTFWVEILIFSGKNKHSKIKFPLEMQQVLGYDD